MSESSALLLFLALALGFHSLVSLLNAALQTVSRASMRERAEDGDSAAARFLALTENPPSLSMTVSIAHILTRFAIAVLLVLLAFESFATADAGGRFLLAFVIVVPGALLTLLLGDLVPEALGSAYAEGLLPLAIAPLRLFLLLMSPITALVLLLSRFISRLAGSPPLVNLVTEEEIMTLVNASHSDGIIEEEEKDMIASVLQLGESSARELMTPRIRHRRPRAGRYAYGGSSRFRRIWLFPHPGL